MTATQVLKPPAISVPGYNMQKIANAALMSAVSPAVYSSDCSTTGGSVALFNIFPGLTVHKLTAVIDTTFVAGSASGSVVSLTVGDSDDVDRFADSDCWVGMSLYGVAASNTGRFAICPLNVGFQYQDSDPTTIYAYTLGDSDSGYSGSGTMHFILDYSYST